MTTPPVGRPRNYTLPEVADILRKNPFYTRELCRGGKIPGAHRMTDPATGNPVGPWLVDVETFDAWRNESMKAAS